MKKPNIVIVAHGFPSEELHMRMLSVLESTHKVEIVTPENLEHRQLGASERVAKQSLENFTIKPRIELPEITVANTTGGNYRTRSKKRKRGYFK